jgi:LruC domain-containing protein
MKKRLISVILGVLLLGLIAGCGNKDTNSTHPMDNVMADEDFMFNTAIYVNIHLESVHNGAAQAEAYFELYDYAIQDGGKRLLQAKTDADGIFEFDLPIAAFKDEIALYNANKDYFEFEIERMDDLTGEINGSFDSPFNSGSREAPDWDYNTSPYYATIFADVYNETTEIYANDMDDMFGCFLGNTCISTTGGIHPGAVMLPDNRVLYTNIMYLPNSSYQQLNFRFYDASANQVYLFEDMYYVQNGNILGSNQDTYTFNYDNSSAMPDPYIMSVASPALDEYGTLAYEDKWPQQGDYDINDLVVYYNFEVYYDDMENYSGYYEIKYKLAAIGASYTIGFGIQFPDYLALSNLQSDTGTAYLETDNYTMIFFDDARDIVPGSGYMNTDPSLPYIEPEIRTITVDFTESSRSRVFMAPWYEMPYNPFIFTNNDRSHEIHPADYPPTDQVDIELWNTGDDTSDPDSGRWYRTVNNMPWFFMMPQEIPYPRERASILDAYPYFDEWIATPWDYENWYLDIQGHRDYNFIYSLVLGN